MPVKRRSRKVMRMRRRKSSYRKKSSSMKLKRQVHYFKRSCTLSAPITASISAGGSFVNIAGGYVVSLDQLPNYTEFVPLFDQYKIMGAKLSFVPGQNQIVGNVNNGTTSAISAQRFVSAIDYDDNTVPTSEAELLEYGSCKWSQGGRVHSRYWKPTMIQEVYNGSGTALAPVKARWLSTNFADVPHYGLKVWCGYPEVPVGTAGGVTYEVYLTLYLAFKNVK